MLSIYHCIFLPTKRPSLVEKGWEKSLPSKVSKRTMKRKLIIRRLVICPPSDTCGLTTGTSSGNCARVCAVTNADTIMVICLHMTYLCKLLSCIQRNCQRIFRWTVIVCVACTEYGSSIRYHRHNRHATLLRVSLDIKYYIIAEKNLKAYETISTAR